MAGSGATVTSFFDRWNVYALIIRHDYMWHREIHAAIRKSLLSKPAGFSVLDLGCGDGSGTATSLQGLTVGKYTGVDSSEAALSAARANLADPGFEVTLVQADFNDYLVEREFGSADIVISGYAAHHLRDHEKAGFLSACFATLDDGGLLFYYDVFRRSGETRKSYLDSYARLIERDWHALSNLEKAGVIEHIREFDFPTTFEDLSMEAADAGFETPQDPLFADETGFHRLYRFQKPS